MHSLKNTFVAITLLAISFGLYQVSLTPDVEIDPADTPEIEVFDGLDDLASSIPDASALPETPARSLNPPNAAGSGFPDFPDLNITQPAGLSDNTPVEKQPLVASTDNNVQTIEYPDGQLESSFPETDLQNDTTELTQRAPIEPADDQGLIEALQSQQEFEAAMSSAQPADLPTDSQAPNEFGDFQATIPNDVATSSPTDLNSSDFNAIPSSPDTAANGNEFQANNASSQYSGNQETGSEPMLAADSESPTYDAQPIASNDSTFNELASNVGQPEAESNGFEGGIAQANREPELSELDFNAAWPKVDQLVEAGQFQDALMLLSRFYRDDQLSGPQRQRLLGWLDALAGKVIFSNEHHLAGQPYTVKSSESLTDIAGQWDVPAQLIYNVNQNSVPNPAMVQPGTQLKVIPGPFSAEVNLSAKVMTLFLGDLYAGRFPIKVGISGEPRPGEFKVIVKSEIGHAWRDVNGVDYPPGSPENGYGPNWMGLTGSLCIHEVDESARDGHHGCIGLDRKDAQDVYAILTEDSVVKILR